MVQNSWGVDDLPPQVLVIHVPNEQRFSRERVRLDVDVCTSDLVHETAFSDVGIPAYDQGSRVGVNGGQTGQMLADFLVHGVQPH